jgi:hypothetical protein
MVTDLRLNNPLISFKFFFTKAAFSLEAPGMWCFSASTPLPSLWRYRRSRNFKNAQSPLIVVCSAISPPHNPPDIRELSDQAVSRRTQWRDGNAVG